MEVDETQLDPTTQEAGTQDSGKRAAEAAVEKANGRAAPKAKVTSAAPTQFGPPVPFEPSALAPKELSFGTFRATGTAGFRALGAIQAYRNRVARAYRS